MLKGAEGASKKSAQLEQAPTRLTSKVGPAAEMLVSQAGIGAVIIGLGAWLLPSVFETNLHQLPAFKVWGLRI